MNPTYFEAMRASLPDSGIPDPSFTITAGVTALLVVDPQNDFLHENGAAFGVVGESVRENQAVGNIELLMMTAYQNGIQLFISPHYYFPHDHGWKFEGALERLMHSIGMFDRPGALSMEGMDGSGADWLQRYKPYINRAETVITSPHKVYGPQNNDLTLQLRKRGISKVLLAGMSANLCVESHLRDLVEQGFEVAVVADATAAAKVPGMDGFVAACVNFRMIASHVFSTAEAVEAMSGAVSELTHH
ncbi:cysteine hydrolase [bacterium]|nr:cysteine hydrolase [bacterium]